MSTEEKVQHINVQPPHPVSHVPYVSDGAPEQHVGAQEQIPNAKTVQAAKRKETATATTTAPIPTPVEEKALEAEDSLHYKNREVKTKRTRGHHDDDEDDKKET